MFRVAPLLKFIPSQCARLAHCSTPESVLASHHAKRPIHLVRYAVTPKPAEISDASVISFFIRIGSAGASSPAA